MDCIQKNTAEEQIQALVPKFRSEIIRDLVSQMFLFNSRLQKAELQ